MEQFKITVKIQGLAPVVFDRFHDHSKEDRPPEQKLYLDENGRLVLPASNLMSLLCSEFPGGVIKVVEKKAYKDYCRIVRSHLSFNAPAFPFSDGAKDIVFSGFDDGHWLKGHLMEGGITRASGGKIIKQEARPRPVLRLPWELEIGINLVMTDHNTKVSPDKLFNWFVTGGVLVGIGSYRPMYGRFEIKDDAAWRVEKV